MKKSLSVVLSTAMAVSVFASAAFAETAPATTTTGTAATATAVKTSADFKDLAGIDAALKAKIDAMLAKGFFEGVSADSFGINENMTRAQFAKILALVAGVTVDESVKTSSFADVKADDAANSWAIPFIEAAKKAGLIDGKSSTSYDPGAKVTLGELATAMVKATGKKVDTTGTPWYGDAVKQAVELKILPEGTDGSKFALRSDLVVSANGTVEAIKNVTPVGAVSVTEAKATGVKSVTVSFDKAVDDTKAKLELVRGTTKVATTAKFAEDKKSVVLTLTDVKVVEGDYTVTLSGLEASAIAKATASFKAENEKVSKISFVNPSEKIAKAAKIVIKLKPENQYGEVATVSGTDYTANIAGTNQTPKRNADTGLLEIEVNTSSDVNYPAEIGVLPVTVSLNQSAVFVQKTFKIGYTQIVSKVELGAPKYAAGKTALSVAADKVEMDITRYDQYGDSILTDIPNTVPAPVVTPNDMNILDKTFDYSNKKLIVTVAANKKVEKTAEHTLTYYEGGASATAKIALKATAIPAKLEFGTFSGTLAAGETKDQYIPIVAYDAEGKQLTADEIVASASLISFSVTGATVATGTDVSNGIVRYGEHKGKLKITSVTAGEKGIVYFFMSIYNANIQTQAQLSVTAQPARIAETVVVTSEPTKKALDTATTTFKVAVKDQYGETVGSVGNADYKVDVTVTGTTYAGVQINGGTAVAEGAVTSFNNTQFGDLNDKEIKYTAKAALGKAKVKVVLYKGTAEVKTIERTVEVIETKDLTYTAKTISDVYAVESNDVSKGDSTLNSLGGKFAKGADVTVTDKAGDTVAVPAKKFVSVFSSDPTVVSASVYGSNEAKVLGLKAGKATITAVIEKANLELQELKYEVNVKAELPAVATLTTKANKAYTNNTDIARLIETKVVDNYGVEFKDAAIEKANFAAYNKFYGVQFIISDVKGTGTYSAVIDTDGKLQITGDVTELVVKAISANGKVATTVLNK